MIKIMSDKSSYLKKLNAISRSRNVYGNELADNHKEIGRILGQEFLNGLPLKDIKVINPQGKTGINKSVDCSNVTIICLMRAGLFVAEGVRQLLGGSQHIYLLSNSPEDIKDTNISGKDVVIIDSVINSGKTISAFLDIAKPANSLSVISIVMQCNFKVVADNEYPDVKFIVSRTSENYYIGAGQTDTGNRLFGTCN